LIMLGGLGLFMLFVPIIGKKVSSNIYPWSLFITAISLLFMYSLRGWHIFASSDIGQEFYVFQLTKSHALWNMAFFQDAYNSCLSITLLPTALSLITAIPDEYIFKLVMQILFAVTPIAIFLFVKNFIKKELAYSAALFLAVSPYFYTELPTLIRQEIAFLFFALLLKSLFNKSLTPLKNKFLVIF